MKITQWNIYPGTQGLDLVIHFDDRDPMIAEGPTIASAAIKIFSQICGCVEALPISIQQVNIVDENVSVTAIRGSSIYGCTFKNEVDATLHAIAMAAGLA